MLDRIQGHAKKIQSGWYNLYQPDCLFQIDGTTTKLIEIH
ncbi:hypothetical protein HMPREF9088_0922 [Enterococcus italicus DSM 15952]|uniref:Uncharacterized protein n=1 Tax=Enterococcus italicus (strain DSM 15952 / CCUG 50447 / LMG 22039 / TP 1.5) TaxID=888064 RepID=E6LF08_ENTI1|nr:hypothetical protein HMPREF9088_0922 [Enterococcus italicus DSM 15952]